MSAEQLVKRKYKLFSHSVRITEDGQRISTTTKCATLHRTARELWSSNASAGSVHSARHGPWCTSSSGIPGSVLWPHCDTTTRHNSDSCDGCTNPGGDPWTGRVSTLPADCDHQHGVQRRSHGLGYLCWPCFVWVLFMLFHPVLCGFL